jgi:multidrug efflux pump subunit AcrA (membrane-fusion protein)
MSTNNQKKKSRKLLWFIIPGFLAVILGLCAIFAFNSNAPKQKYLTETVKKGDISLEVSATGKVSPKRNQQIFALTAAKVKNVYVLPGTHVNADQTIAELDDADLQTAYNQAKLQGREARKKAERDLEKAKIKAPFAGEITQVNLFVGGYSNLSQAAFTIISPDSYEVLLNINEIDIQKVIIGQEVSAEIDAIGETRKGKIETLVNTGDVSSGVVTYQARVSLEDVKLLRPNMTVNADILVQSKKDILIIPSGAIIERDGKSYVKVVKNVEGKEVLEEKEVTIGINNNATAEVLTGLSEGEKVAITVGS